MPLSICCCLFHKRLRNLIYTIELLIVWFSHFFQQGLSPYEKKKYVWKMLYIFMLGYDVDFGHMEAVSLISAPKYPEKQVT